MRVKDGKVMDEVVYGVTSLTQKEASPARLLELVRTHWQIENGLHYWRDDTLKQDRCTLRGQAAEAMAVINNLVVALVLHHGVKYFPEVRRHYHAHLAEAVNLLIKRPA